MDEWPEYVLCLRNQNEEGGGRYVLFQTPTEYIVHLLKSKPVDRTSLTYVIENDRPCLFRVDLHCHSKSTPLEDVLTGILENLRDFCKKELGIEEDDFDKILIESLYVCADDGKKDGKNEELQIYIRDLTFADRYDLTSFLIRWRRYASESKKEWYHSDLIDTQLPTCGPFLTLAKTPDSDLTPYPYFTHLPSLPLLTVHAVPAGIYVRDKRQDIQPSSFYDECEWCTRPLNIKNVRVCYRDIIAGLPGYNVNQRFHLCKACVDGEYQLQDIYKHIPDLDTFDYRPYVYFYQHTKWSLKTIRQTLGTTRITDWWDWYMVM